MRLPEIRVEKPEASEASLKKRWHHPPANTLFCGIPPAGGLQDASPIKIRGTKEPFINVGRFSPYQLSAAGTTTDVPRPLKVAKLGDVLTSFADEESVAP